MRVSKADGSQVLDLQKDALLAYGIDACNIYEDHASGQKDERSGLTACVRGLNAGDTLVVWKLDRLGRSLKHLVDIVQELQIRTIGLKILAGEGANIDTTTANGRLIFGIFATIAEYECALISERTKAGLSAARERGRVGGRKFKMTSAKIVRAKNAMEQPETKIEDLCRELDISRQTLYRHISPIGQLRPDAKKLLANEKAVR